MNESLDLSSFLSSVEVLQWRAKENPDKIAVTFLEDGEREINLTYQELDDRARTLAVWIQKFAQPGDRVVMLYPASIDSIVSFYACMYAGVVGVLTGLPRPNSSLENLEAVVEQSGAISALTTSSYLSSIQNLLKQSSLQSFTWISSDQISSEIHADQWQKPELNRETLALLIFTSGSTNVPKGVMISQNNLLTEMKAAFSILHLNLETVAVSFAPLYHVGGIFFPTVLPASGLRLVFFPTQSFVERPIRWLNAISRYQGTISFSFNFGLQSVIERTTPEERASLDLSSWNACVIGGERIRADLLESFYQLFKPQKFQKEAFQAAYGLTESFGFVTLSRPDPAGIRSYALDQAALGQNQVKILSADADLESKKGLWHVSCGVENPAKHTIIVNPQTHEICGPDQVGEIWILRENLSKGYWNRPEETEESFCAYTANTNDGPYFRTGDLGCFINDELIVTGRIKEMIILHGKNFYAQDIERSVDASHPALIKGALAAFPYPYQNEERLAIMAEIKQGASETEIEDAIRAIRLAVARDQQQSVFLITLIKQGTIYRATNGKIIRYACRNSLLNGQLDAVKISYQVMDSEKPNEADGSSEYVAPSNPIERALSGIWSSVLGKTKISVNDNFYDIGGDSLTGMQILSQIEDVFQVEIPQNTPVETFTISSLSRLITELRDHS